MGDVTKLPKWAQRQIASLEADNARLRKLIDELSALDSPVRWRVNVPRAGGSLPRRASVEFLHQGRDTLQVQLRRSNARPGRPVVLTVRCIDGDLRIAPRTSNWVEVWSD